MLLALALGMSFVQASHATAQLVASVSAVKGGEPFYAAVVFHTDPGWHVYWQNPGDSGTPTQVEWQLPAGWKAGPLLWPVPQRFSDKTLVTYGYEGSTLLMAQITPSTDVNAGPTAIRAKASWLCCNAEACIPGSSDLHLGLTLMPVKSGLDLRWGQKLLDAQKALPQAIDGWSFQASKIKDGFLLKAKPPQTTSFTGGLPTFFASDQAVIDPGYPINLKTNDDGSFWMALKQSQFMAKQPDHLRGLLVAPKGQPWKDGIDAIIVDVPLEENK